MNRLKEVEKKPCRNGVEIFENERAATGEEKNRWRSQLRKENKVSFNRAEKGTWIYYFILAFDSYCSAIFLFWACRILFINPEVEEMMVERRRGSRTGEERRKKREKRAKVLCFGFRTMCVLWVALFPTRLMMYGNVRHQLSGESGILGHGEESHSLNVRQVWHPTSRRLQIYVCREGFSLFFCGHSGEEMASTKQRLAVFWRWHKTRRQGNGGRRLENNG